MRAYIWTSSLIGFFPPFHISRIFQMNQQQEKKIQKENRIGEDEMNPSSDSSSYSYIDTPKGKTL